MKAEELVGLVAKHMRDQKPDLRDRNGQIFASDLGHEGCKLGFWRKLKNFPQQEPGPGELLMFMQGDRLEEIFADILGEVLTNTGEWTVVDRQTSVSFEEINGRLDILLRNVKTGDLMVIEVKTKRGNAFRYLDEPKQPNVIQTRFYMAATDAAKGLLVYIDREGQNFMKIFPVERDDDSVREAIRQERTLFTGPEPEPTLVSVVRNINKGDDSFSLSIPWQISWCRDKDCPCAKPTKGIPTTVIAKGKKNAEGKYSQVYATPGNEAYLDIIINLIKREGWME